MNENLKSIDNKTLISNVKALVSKEIEITTQILNYLNEIQRRRLYAELGYSSLFVFCVKQLGYPESQAQRRIEAMRAMRDIPEIETKIKEGALNLTVVSQAQSYFKSQEKINNPISLEKKKEVLSNLENKSTRECEKILVSLQPEKPLPKEKIKQVTNTHSQATLNLPNELLEKLEKIKSLLSHKNTNFGHAELINEMAEIVLDKIDPARKAIKSQRRVYSAQEVRATPRDTVPKFRRYIPSKIRQSVWQNQNSKCSYVIQDGIVCASTFQLQLDHIKPLSLGGSNSIENLRLLCSTHNRSEAVRLLGHKTMTTYLKN